jgi:hypothetical protein
MILRYQWHNWNIWRIKRVDRYQIVWMHPSAKPYTSMGYFGDMYQGPSKDREQYERQNMRGTRG